MIMKWKIVWRVLSVMISIWAAYTLLNTIVIEPRTKRRVAKAMQPVKEELKSKSDSLRIVELQRDHISLKLDSTEIQSQFNKQQVGRLQVEIGKIARQNRKLQEAYRVDLIKLRVRRNGSVIDSTYIENYKR